MNTSHPIQEAVNDKTIVTTVVETDDDGDIIKLQLHFNDGTMVTLSPSSFNYGHQVIHAEVY